MHLRDTLDDDRKRRQWRGERVGWFCMFVLVALAGAGFFGGGPVAWKVERLESGGAAYALDYETWNRYHAVTLLVLRVDAPGTEGDELRVSFARPFAEGVTIRSSSPSADGGSVGPAGQTYVFQVENWSSPLVVSFEALPERIGSWSAPVTVEAGSREPVVLPVLLRVFP